MAGLLNVQFAFLAAKARPADHFHDAFAAIGLP
jgi:hypothetical protein